MGVPPPRLSRDAASKTMPNVPVYTADAFPYIRVECCDTCQTYVKSIDLTKNGLAEPLVDDLASVPLNLWAQEHGYAKLHPNLLGMGSKYHLRLRRPKRLCNFGNAVQPSSLKLDQTAIKPYKLKEQRHPPRRSVSCDFGSFFYPF